MKNPSSSTESAAAGGAAEPLSQMQQRFREGWKRLVSGLVGAGHSDFAVDIDQGQLVLTGAEGFQQRFRETLASPQDLRRQIGYILVPITGESAADMLPLDMAPAQAYVPGENGLVLFKQAFHAFIANGYLPPAGWQEVSTGVRLVFKNPDIARVQLEQMKAAVARLTSEQIMRAFANEAAIALPLDTEAQPAGPLQDCLDHILQITDADGVVSLTVNLQDLYKRLQPPEAVQTKDADGNVLGLTVSKNDLLQYLSFIYGNPRVPLLTEGGQVDLVAWSEKPFSPKPTRYVFVLDTSGSMARDMRSKKEEAIKEYKNAIRGAVNVLNAAKKHPDDRVCFSPFSDSCSLPGSAGGAYSEFSLADLGIGEKINDYLDGAFDSELRRGGNTRLSGSVADHYRLMRGDSSFQSTLILLTDGKTNVDKELGDGALRAECKAMGAERRPPKAFIVACGPAVDQDEVQSIGQVLGATIIEAGNAVGLQQLEFHIRDLQVRHQVLRILAAAQAEKTHFTYEGHPVVLQNVGSAGETFVIEGQAFEMAAVPPALPVTAAQAGGGGGKGQGQDQGASGRVTDCSMLVGVKPVKAPILPTATY